MIGIRSDQTIWWNVLNSKKLLEQIKERLSDHNLSEREIAIIKHVLRVIADIAFETTYVIELPAMEFEMDRDDVTDWIDRQREKRVESKNEH